MPAARKIDLVGDPQSDIRVMAQAMSDCNMSHDRDRDENRTEHEEIFNRIRALEIVVATISTKLVVWGAIGAVIGGAVVQLFVSIIKPLLSG